MAIPTRDDPQFKLRIPRDLKALLEMSAASNSRSVTAEIIARLQMSFENNEPDYMRMFASVPAHDQPKLEKQLALLIEAANAIRGIGEDAKEHWLAEAERQRDNPDTTED